MSNPNPKQAILASLIRTAVPVIVGAVVGLLVKVGMEDLAPVVENAATTIITVAYYAVARVLEERVGPAWGWLLGYAKAPSYTPAAPTAPSPTFNAVGDYGDVT